MSERLVQERKQSKAKQSKSKAKAGNKTHRAPSNSPLASSSSPTTPSSCPSAALARSRALESSARWRRCFESASPKRSEKESSMSWHLRPKASTRLSCDLTSARISMMYALRSSALDSSCLVVGKLKRFVPAFLFKIALPVRSESSTKADEASARPSLDDSEDAERLPPPPRLFFFALFSPPSPSPPPPPSCSSTTLASFNTPLLVDDDAVFFFNFSTLLGARRRDAGRRDRDPRVAAEPESLPFSLPVLANEAMAAGSSFSLARDLQEKIALNVTESRSGCSVVSIDPTLSFSLRVKIDTQACSRSS